MDECGISGLKEAAVAACYDWQWKATRDLLEDNLEWSSTEYKQLANIKASGNILVESCYNGYVELVSVFIKSGFPVNQEFRKIDFYTCDTLLTCAVFENQLALIKYLLSCGADVNAHGTDGSTPLHYACEKDNLELVKFLVEVGADIRTRLETGETVLHRALTFSQIEIVKFLLEMDFDPNVDSYYESPLCTAARHGSINCVKALLDYGADVNPKTGMLPLHCAAAESQLYIMKYLLYFGACLDATDKYGDMAIHTAAGYGSLESVKFVLSKGGSINSIGKEGQTPLQCALTNWDHNVAVVNFLLSKGADVNSCYYNGKTILHCAVQGEAVPLLIELLLENDAFVNAVDSDGVTALHKLVFYHNAIEEQREGLLEDIINIARIFINWGAQISIVDDQKHTLLHWAAWQGSVSLVQHLIQLGIDVNARDADGKKAIDLAEEAGHYDVVQSIVYYNCNKRTCL